MLRSRIGQDIAFMPLSQQAIIQALENRWKGENYSDRVWKNTQLVAQEAGKIIDTGITSGASVAQMTYDIKDLFDVAAYAAARLIRTETNRMHNDAAIQSYKAMGIKEYIFLAALDARTCAKCGALDLKRFKVSEAQTGVNLPPMHPNDRCTTVAYYTGEDRQGTRIARNPKTGRNYKVDRHMTYEQWRKEVGTEALEKAQKRYANLKRDIAEQRSMQKVLVKEIPANIAEFQELKYNNPEEFARLKRAVADQIIKNRLASDAQPKTIDSGKQGKHIKGHNNYISGRSYLIISEKEAQQLVNRYAGTGTIQRDHSGKFANRELIVADRNIGVSINPKTGEETLTNRFYIHYSKTGVHIVPTLKGGG